MLFSFALACSFTSSTQDTEKNDSMHLEDISLEALLPRVASSVCQKLTDCCDESSQELYFYSYASNEHLTEYVDQLPPNVVLDIQQCTDLMNEMLPKVWFGNWIDQTERGLVSYVPEAAAQCLAELEGAECGEESRTALFDSECFGIVIYGAVTLTNSIILKVQRLPNV